MEYSVGKTGKVVAMRLNEGEDLYECIESVAKKEGIECGTVFITGGIRKAKVVVGPTQEKPKLVANFKDFEGPGETLGVGTIYCDDDGPKLHIHTAMGRGDNVVVGCPRGGASTFLILEVTIIELVGVGGSRKLDKDSGLRLLGF